MKRQKILFTIIFVLVLCLPFNIKAAVFDTFYYILEKPEVGGEPATTVTEVYKVDDILVNEEFSIKWLEYDPATDNYVTMSTSTFSDKKFYKFELVDVTLENDWKDSLVNEGHSFASKMDNITEYRQSNFILTGVNEFSLGGIDYFDIDLKVPVAGEKPNNVATISGPIGVIKNKNIEIKWYEYIDKDTNIPMTSEYFEEGKTYDFEIVTPINEYVTDEYFVGSRVLIDDRTSINSDSHIYAGYFGPLEKLFKINYDFENILLIEPQEYIRPNSPFSLILKPNFGYELPDEINVIIDGTELPKDKYIYNIEDNSLNIDGQYITGNLDIKISATPIEIKITNNTKNLISSNSSTKINVSDGYTTTFSANDGYKLPNYIDVIIDGSYLSNDMFTYNKETGELNIPVLSLTGDVTIEGNAIKIVQDKTEIKKFDEIQYKLEQTSDQNYLCDELKNSDYLIESYINQNKIIFITPDDKYLVDISQKGKCEKIADEQYDRIVNDEPWYEYYFDYDDTIKKVNATSAYILTTDTNVILNKTYYVYDDDKWIVVETPVDSSLTTYYERFYITYDNEFNENHEYYTVNFDGVLTKVTNPIKEEFDEGRYLIKDENAKEEILLTIDKDTKFILPSEKNHNNGDYEFNKGDFNWIHTVGNKTYLVFDDGHSGELHLYNLDGTMVDIPIKYDYIEYVSVTSENDLYILTVKDNSDTFIHYLVDENFNVVFKYEADSHNYQIAYLGTIEGIDYYAIMSPEHETIILKVTKGNDFDIVPPLTYDGIDKSILMGMIAMIGLIISTIYLKKESKKGVN